MPGMYKVRVEAKGFKTSERTGIQVVVASDAQIDFELQAGQASETITVTGQAPLINTTSSSLGGTLSNKEINDLPLNGRNYENLLQLRPGVVRYPGGGFSTTSANGLRAEDNAISWMVSSTASLSQARALSMEQASRATPQRFCPSTPSRNSR
jgi:hypothetical protein